ncbi:hypothetical protein V6N11_031866 [Hibiscus sabdariffa]|uniref:Uncharacterized protein n=1 Tax=Hibiscus sabdariffa TaxID=183260 RepID=A0ABR2SZM8_9ROSI
MTVLTGLQSIDPNHFVYLGPPAKNSQVVGAPAVPLAPRTSPFNNPHLDCSPSTPNHFVYLGPPAKNSQVVGAPAVPLEPKTSPFNTTPTKVDEMVGIDGLQVLLRRSFLNGWAKVRGKQKKKPPSFFLLVLGLKKGSLDAMFCNT